MPKTFFMPILADDDLPRVADAMWNTSVKLRQQLLRHSPVDYVYASPRSICFDDFTVPQVAAFTHIEEFKTLARFDGPWWVRLDVFLRLAELKRVLPHFMHACHQDYLVNKKNLPHLAWSLWLTNQHINFYDNAF